MIRLGTFLFKYRDIVVPVVLVALAFAFPPRLYQEHAYLNVVLNGVGIAVVLSGQLLRAIVIGYAYIKRGGKNKKVYADTLQQDGVFAHCRNPLYVGNILMLVGLMIVHGNPIYVALSVAFVLLVYTSIVAAEEAYLRDKFGEEYAAYCSRVPRWWVRLGGMRATLRDMSFDWGRLVRKEYGTTFTCASAAIGLLAWESVLQHGSHGDDPELMVLLALWGVVILGWVVARYLKKRTTVLGAA